MGAENLENCGVGCVRACRTVVRGFFNVCSEIADTQSRAREVRAEPSRTQRASLGHRMPSFKLTAWEAAKKCSASVDTRAQRPK